MNRDFTQTGNLPPNPGGLLERLLDEVEAQESRPAPSPEPPPPSTSSPPSPSEPPPSSDRSAPASPGGSPLSTLLSNPALLAALPTLMENLTPLLGGLSGGIGGTPNASRPHYADRHTALLCALKPYLSPHRRETAETVIRLCRVWDALERSGISLTGLLGSLGGGTTPPLEGRDDRVQ
ncbi:MAG: hypothetical protein J6K29_10445 [Clostridia bacterium]|nr:hypothetical protein [Clostridia bacterium]